VNTPVLDADGHVAYLIHQVEDVTEFMRFQQQSPAEQMPAPTLPRRHVGLVVTHFVENGQIPEQVSTICDITARKQAEATILGGGGKMGVLMRAYDWATSPLGPVSSWPQSLRTAMSICLNSRSAILLWWGPDLVMLYNDAYSTVIGDKHPDALGQRGRDCWPEIWSIIEPMLEGVLNTGQATWANDLQLLLRRHGYIEECYFTFSYSPIQDESGSVGGVFTLF
jgi:hypothetical protein